MSKVTMKVVLESVYPDEEDVIDDTVVEALELDGLQPMSVTVENIEPDDEEDEGEEEDDLGEEEDDS